MLHTLFAQSWFALCAPNVPQDQISYNARVRGLTNTAIIKQVPKFNCVYKKYASRLMHEFGFKVDDCANTNLSNSDKEFVQRYISAIILRLAITPSEQREDELETVKLLIPISREEYNYICGDGPPSCIQQIGKVECWPLRNMEIQQRINCLKDIVNQNEKVNRP